MPTHAPAEPTVSRPSLHLRSALLGAGAGLRSFAVPALLGANGLGPFPGPARFIAFGAAAGELVSDKQPDANNRWAVRGLSLRLAGAANGGFVLGGRPGAIVAAASAVASARIGSQVRIAHADDPHPWRIAVAEDLLAYGLVAASLMTLER